ncbi:MAG: kelch repeat-containing protein [Flavobacteriales bacterium]
MRIACSIAFLAPLAALAQTWTQLPDFPGTARDDAASFTIDGVIYVGTGMEVGWGLTNDWYAFDTQSGIWSPIAPLPATPRQYCTGFTLEGNGYLFGGVDANGALNELWCYYPDLNQWQERAPLPGEGRYACVATGDGGGTGYIATGMLASGVPTNEHWLYTASVDNWFSAQPVPGPARHRAASFTNNAFVIAGGADANGVALSDVWQYEIIFPTGDWVAGPDLPAPRIDAKGVSGWNVIVGGASDASTFHADAWMLTGGSWTSLPSFAGGNRRGPASAGISGADGGVFLGTGLGDLQRYRDWWKLALPVGIAESSTGAFRVFPNPARDMITIQTPNPVVAGRCEIIDGTGRTVLTLSIKNGDPISVDHLSPGRYEVVMRSPDVVWRAPLIKLP